MNILVVNIGSTCIMKEPLTIFTKREGAPYISTNININPQYQPLLKIQPDLSIKPKFAFNTSKSINTPNKQEETLTKLQKKTDVLTKILNLYFGGNDDDESYETQLITEIQTDIMKQKQNDDFSSFQKMISILASETKANFSFYSTMTKLQYEELSSYQKSFLLKSIREIEYQILIEHMKLFEPSFNSVVQSNYSSSNNNEIKQNQQPSNTTNKNTIRTYYDIQREQNETFRQYINNAQLPEKEIKKYVNICNGDILKGVDIYFQTIFKLSMLTLRYIYDDNNEEIVHYFSFTAEVIELINVVKEDRPFIEEFSLFTFDNKEIDTKTNLNRLIGTMELTNNSPLIVKEKKIELSLDL